MTISELRISQHYAALLLLVLLATLAVYTLGIGGGFQFDDFSNIVVNRLLQTEELSFDAIRQASLSSSTGGLGRPVSMLSFWANHYVSGLDARVYKLTNIFIHLFNGIAVYWLCMLLVRGHALARAAADPPPDRVRVIALTASALWLLHPLNLTSVLYVVQRMTSLAALFTLIGAACYAEARLQLMRGQPGFGKLVASFLSFGLLASLSKENGVLLPLYLFAIEICLFQFAAARPADRRMLQVFFGAVLAIPGFLLFGLFLASPEWLLGGYQSRSFNLYERLLTEFRVLWHYLGWALVPNPAALGLFHDDLEISRGLLQPWTTLLALAGIVCLLLVATLNQRRLPLFRFAVAWFFFGHALESTVFPLELVHEHRNYLPLAGVAIAVAYGLHSFPQRIPSRLPLLISLAWTLFLASATAVRAHQWSDPTLLVLKEAENHPDSARANYEAAIQLLQVTQDRTGSSEDEAQRRHITALLNRSLAQDKDAILGYYGLIALALQYRQPVEDQWLADMAQRLRTTRNDPLLPLTALNELLIKVKSGTPTQEQIVTLFTAAMENPKTSNSQRALLLVTLARYFAMVAGNNQQAVQLTIAATEYNPQSAQLRLSLAKLANTLGNFAYARDQLAQAKSMDKVGRLAFEINQLEAELAAPR